MATRAERLARIRAIQNPDKATEEVLAYLSTLVKPVEVGIPLPIKGEDYFTQQDINDIADIVRGMIKDGVDGKDGEKGEKGDIGPQGERGEVGPKGQKGEDGKDGESPNVDDLIKNVLKKIPKANPDEIVKLVLNKIELPDTKELISKTELVDFLKRGGFRGGGGGLQSVVAGSGVTVDNTDPLNPVITSAGSGADWTYYATTWSTEPTLNASITGGDVYDYTLDGVTRYRFVPTTYDATQDAFYTSFSNPTLSGLIVARG